MVMDVSDPLVDNDSEAEVPENAVDRPQANTKRSKVPKKILKAERERLKREQLNEHFDRLASVLELSEQNNGKASILCETVRVVKDLVSQIQILGKENATLMSESHYMTAEKNELKDENSALEAEIEKIRSELQRGRQSETDLNRAPQEVWQPEMGSQFIENHLPQMLAVDPSRQQPPILGPLYIVPVAPDLQTFQKVDAISDPPIAVSKPHARYPTPADSWPLHLLSKRSEATS